MYSLLIFAVMLAVGGGALLTARAARLRRLAAQRIAIEIHDESSASEALLPKERTLRPFPRRFLWAPPLFGLLAACLVLKLTTLPNQHASGPAVLIVPMPTMS